MPVCTTLIGAADDDDTTLKVTACSEARCVVFSQLVVDEHHICNPDGHTTSPPLAPGLFSLAGPTWISAV